MGNKNKKIVIEKNNWDSDGSPDNTKLSIKN